jgi:hypothetical protein
MFEQSYQRGLDANVKIGEHIARTDAAEAREQLLVRVFQTAIDERAMWDDPGNALDVIVRYLQSELSTLYSDTPAPKEGSS